MKEQELLNDLINNLNEKDFDLEVWKERAIMLMNRIFGPQDSRIKRIQDLHADYSSWSLRDTSGRGALEACKKKAHQIIKAAVEELELFGLPEQNTPDEDQKLELLEDLLTVKEYKTLRSLLTDKSGNQDEKLMKFLAGLGQEKITTALVRLLRG
ncbi:MAG: hypothetical protein Kow00127_14390 [Bacteroidales bacterium]